MGGIPPSEPPRGCIPPPGRGVPWAQVLYPLPGRGWPKAQVLYPLPGGQPTFGGWPKAQRPMAPIGGGERIHSREASRGGKHPSVPPPVP
jgi:hypothetical protein